MSFHIDVLDEAQKGILPRLGAFATSQGFYLAGGTAVALHLGHRRSVDFDWFSLEPIGDHLVLAEQARESGLTVENVQVAPRTLHAVIGGVRVSFFDYPYQLIAAPVPWPDYSVNLASLDDLACMKLAAVAQCGSRKDFVDIHGIALHHKPLRELLELYRGKYSADDIGHVLAGLAYFDDAEQEPSPAMLWEASWNEIKRDFRDWVRGLAM